MWITGLTMELEQYLRESIRPSAPEVSLKADVDAIWLNAVPFP
jgi:hypothetical protein